MAMTMVPVSSEAIRALGYDGETKTLFIEFNKLKDYPTYQFAPVSGHVAGRMFNAGSIGRYYWRHIANRYQTTPDSRLMDQIQRDNAGGSTRRYVLKAIREHIEALDG